MHADSPIPGALPASDEFPAVVSTLTRTYADAWKGTPSSFPVALPRYTSREQHDNERKFLATVQHAHPGKGGSQRAFPWGLQGASRRRAAKLLLAEIAAHDTTAGLPAEEFAETTRWFLERARRFDRTLSRGATAQALRNLWVFCSLRHLAGKSVTLTPSALAYSLLYPYTDNALDRAAGTERGREKAAARVTAMLQGERPPNLTSREMKVRALLDMIEEEFPSTRFPLVRASLAAIQRAQQRSLAQQRWGARRSVLHLSMEKGGTSVLADAVLAGVGRDADWLDAAFGYGCVLQLLDDLQDMRGDRLQGNRTLFSEPDATVPREARVSRLLRFSAETLTGWEFLRSRRQRNMRTLMIHSCHILVFEAIARQDSCFSREYLQNLIRHAPVSLPFLASLRRRFPN